MVLTIESVRELMALGLFSTIRPTRFSTRASTSSDASAIDYHSDQAMGRARLCAHPRYCHFGQSINMIDPISDRSHRSRGVAMQDPGRLGSQKFGLWCNWIFVLLTGVGWLGIAHFYLPARADLGLDATKVWFSETHHWGVIIGCTLFYIAAGILTPGSIAFGIML